MIISSRTPEGDRNRCPVCGHKCKIVPACTTSRDAPCPRCGQLLWFAEKEVRVAAPPIVKSTSATLDVTSGSQLPPDIDAVDYGPTKPRVKRPQGVPPTREPAAQAARLIARLLRRGTEDFGAPWPWQRHALEQIQEPFAAERLLSLLHEARSWRGLFAAWEAERAGSKS
jgi:hypothetical protein